MNGDIGRVLRLSGKELIVEFEGEAGAKEIALEGKDKFEMDLAYATTIHSSQGSEYPGVIVPVTSAHHYMLSRNLLYLQDFLPFVILQTRTYFFFCSNW